MARPATERKHTVLPAAIDIVKMCGEAEAQKLTSIPLSDNTFKQRMCASNQEGTLNNTKTPQRMLSKWTLAARAAMPMHSMH